MKTITILLITMYAICCAFTSCSHGIAKGYSNTDTIDTIEVDTVEADSVIYDEEYGDIRYYEDEYLYFRYPSEYTCVQASDGSIVLFGDTLMHNFMVFDYGELLPNESSESVVKQMVIRSLQSDPKAKLTYSSDIPVLPEYKDIQNQYLAIIEVQDEQSPAQVWILGNLLKNGHIHVSTSRTDNEHDNKMFQAILKTVVMR
jgi:hypothetical protein